MASEWFGIGSGMRQYRGGQVNSIMLILTEECNLRCKYCYLAHKNSEHVMPLEVAYRAIDFLLEWRHPKPGVVLDLTGGEPTLEMGLLQNVVRRFRERLSERPSHPWHDAFMISVGTNGTTYCSDEYQRFLWENLDHVQTAITIDGIKKKHDMNRVYGDGRGSYDTVLKSVLLWLRQNPHATTKVTFSSADLPFLCDSILHLWELGFQTVPANVVFEDVWQAHDPEVFEEQLRALADATIEKGLWRSHNTTLFWVPTDKSSMIDKNWCGTGDMISVDARGLIYPCLRFQDYSIAKPGRRGRSIGSIYDGFNKDALRAFNCLRRSLLSPQKCKECAMEDMCAWCTGWNYDDSATGTVFSRALYICEMHKARWRANQYFWQKLEAVHGVKPAPVMRVAVACPL